MITALVLPEDHPWRDEARLLGSVAYDGPIGGLSSLARTPIDLLLLDASRLAAQDLLDLRAYRIARPDTRIAVSVPERVKPGDLAMTRLVEMGVYDLSTSSLADTLSRRSSYADAVRWLADDSAPLARTVTRPSSGLVIVAGACPGAGTTTLAALVATALSDAGRNAVLIDAAAMPGASRLETIRAVREEPRGGHLAVERILALAETAIAVADIGTLGECAGLDKIIRRADRVLVAVPCAPHRLAWVETLAQGPGLPQGATWVIVGGEADQAARTGTRLKGVLGNPSIVHLPLHSPQVALDQLLGDLIPSGRKTASRAHLRRLGATWARTSGLARTSLEQAAWMLGRLAGLLAAAAMIAVLAVVVVPSLAHIQAVSSVSTWVADRWQAMIGGLTP